THPHTSAGRIPTEKGYRFYVDHLFEEDAFFKHEEQVVREAEKLVRREDASLLLKDTSRLLSELTHYMAIVTAPKFSVVRIKHIEFVRLRRNCIMAIAVSESGFVQNKFFEIPKDLSQKELNKISDYLNKIYTGMTFSDIRQRMTVHMEKMKDLFDYLESEAFELTEQAIKESNVEEGADLYMDGTAQMLDLPDFSDFKMMKVLLNAFKEKKAIVQLLDKYIGSDGVQVFIGTENRVLGKHCSLVVSQYKREDRVLGVLGVIGPTRMDYSKVIPVVESTAKKVGRLLEDMS
ncbi:MAG: heat-inducible transcriptional repressor HrcA, partial [Nitrospiria bacterium]